MHITFCSHNAELEGAPLHILHLAFFLQAEGHTVEICSPTKGPLLELAGAKGIDARVVPFLYSDRLHISSVKKTILSAKPDCIFVSTLLGARIVELLHAVPDSCPIAWIIQESECHEIMRNHPHITPDVFAMASTVIFASQHTQSLYEQWNTGNMHVIHNGVDVQYIRDKVLHTSTEALRTKFGIPHDALVTTLVGTMCPRKGQKEFVLSALTVLDEMPAQKNHFLLAGKMIPEFKSSIDEVLHIAKERGFADRFHVLPEQENVLEYFLCSDVYVCNSFIESFPIVVLEAMACGLPIAASQCYGIQEQIIDGESGLLHLSGNVSQLAQNMHILLNNEPLRRRLGRNAFERVSENFSHEKICTQYSNLVLRITTP